MNLKEAQKADFDIDVKIAGGSGQRDDPFVFEACAAAEAVRSQLVLSRGLGRGRRELWRLLTVENEVGGSVGLQALQIGTVLFRERRSLRRRLYFDTRAIDGLSAAAETFVVWFDARTPFAAPAQLGWLHFDRVTDNAPGPNCLDVSLFDSAVWAKTTVYLYETDNAKNDNTMLSPADVRGRELAAACGQVQQANPNAGRALADRRQRAVCPSAFYDCGKHVNCRDYPAGIAHRQVAPDVSR